MISLAELTLNAAEAGISQRLPHISWATLMSHEAFVLSRTDLAERSISGVGLPGNFTGLTSDIRPSNLGCLQLDIAQRSGFAL